MKCGLFVVIVVGPAMLLSFPEPSRARQNRMRDLILYDKAGPYAAEPSPDGAALNKAVAEIREFLWIHWRQHRLGHLRATFYSKEGEPSTHNVFIEPDPTGRWGILVETERVRSSRRGEENQPLRESSTVAYDVVERIEPPRDGLSRPNRISEKLQRQPETYVLRLRVRKTKQEIMW